MLPKVSVMSGKLQGMRAYNVNTLSNLFCQAMHSTDREDSICSKCYSFSMLQGHRKNCVPRFQQNSEILSEPLEIIPVINDATFRFDGHGELINYTHLVNYHRIAVENPWCTFSLWTKRKVLIAKYHKEHVQPKNLIFIYSNPWVDAIVREIPKGFDKVFNNVTKGSHRQEQNCTGQKCIECRQCYTLPSQSKFNVVVEEVK